MKRVIQLPKFPADRDLLLSVVALFIFASATLCFARASLAGDQNSVTYYVCATICAYVVQGLCVILLAISLWGFIPLVAAFCPTPKVVTRLKEWFNSKFVVVDASDPSAPSAISTHKAESSLPTTHIGKDVEAKLDEGKLRALFVDDWKGYPEFLDVLQEHYQDYCLKDFGKLALLICNNKPEILVADYLNKKARNSIKGCFSVFCLAFYDAFGIKPSTDRSNYYRGYYRFRQHFDRLFPDPKESAAK